jgi:hypothetical protein
MIKEEIKIKMIKKEIKIIKEEMKKIMERIDYVNTIKR